MSDVIGVSARQLSGVIEADLATPALPLGAPHEVDDHDHEKNHDEGSNEGHRSIVSKARRRINFLDGGRRRRSPDSGLASTGERFVRVADRHDGVHRCV
jgi:hypothetical protein